MDFEITDAELEKVASDPNYNGCVAVNIAKAFRKVVNLIDAVSNESELYKFKSLRFEKLKGNRDHQRSFRLNEKWRLIVELETGDTGSVVVIKGIEDYH